MEIIQPQKIKIEPQEGQVKFKIYYVSGNVANCDWERESFDFLCAKLLEEPLRPFIQVSGDKSSTIINLKTIEFVTVDLK